MEDLKNIIEDLDMVRARLNMKLAESNPNETDEHLALVNQAHYHVHEAYTALLHAEGHYGDPLGMQKVRGGIAPGELQIFTAGHGGRSILNPIDVGAPEVRVSRL